MRPFRFGLEKVLSWRRTQFEIARADLLRRSETVAALDRARTEIEAARATAETDVRRRETIDGSDLAALSGFRTRIRETGLRIDAARAEAERGVAEQRAATLGARRGAELLERLRERRLRQWTAAAAKEIEEAAAESHLGRRTRGRA